MFQNTRYEKNSKIFDKSILKDISRIVFCLFLSNFSSLLVSALFGTNDEVKEKEDSADVCVNSNTVKDTPGTAIINFGGRWHFEGAEPLPQWADKWDTKKRSINRGIAYNAKGKVRQDILATGPLYRQCTEQEHYFNAAAEKQNDEKLQSLRQELENLRSSVKGRNGMRKMSKREMPRVQFKMAKLLIDISFLAKEEWKKAIDEAILMLNGLKKTQFATQAKSLRERILKFHNQSEKPVWLHHFEKEDCGSDHDDIQRAIAPQLVGQVLAAVCQKVNVEVQKAQSVAYWELLKKFFPSDANTELGRIMAPLVSTFLESPISEELFNHYCFGTSIPNLVCRFMGSSYEALDEVLSFERNPLKLCFSCGLISNGGILFAALKGSETNGVMTLPKDIDSEDSCPFCGENLHINPPQFEFKFRCPFAKEDGTKCEEELLVEPGTWLHFSKHDSCDESRFASYILQEYESGYEEWRIETGSDAPPLLEYNECTHCERSVPVKETLFCKGCPKDEIVVLYCSRDCQKNDWKYHKRECLRVDKIQRANLCGNCNAECKQALRCRGCDLKNSVYYCSNECARADWKRHKRQCARLDKQTQI